MQSEPQGLCCSLEPSQGFLRVRFGSTQCDSLGTAHFGCGLMPGQASAAIDLPTSAVGSPQSPGQPSLHADASTPERFRAAPESIPRTAAPCVRLTGPGSAQVCLLSPSARLHDRHGEHSLPPPDQQPHLVTPLAPHLGAAARPTHVAWLAGDTSAAGAAAGQHTGDTIIQLAGNRTFTAWSSSPYWAVLPFNDRGRRSRRGRGGSDRFGPGWPDRRHLLRSAEGGGPYRLPRRGNEMRPAGLFATPEAVSSRLGLTLGSGRTA